MLLVFAFLEVSKEVGLAVPELFSTLFALLRFKNHKGCHWSEIVFPFLLHHFEDFHFLLLYLWNFALKVQIRSLIKLFDNILVFIREENGSDLDFLLFDHVRQLVDLLFESFLQVGFERLVEAGVFQISGGVLNSQPFRPNHSGNCNFDAKIRNCHSLQVPTLEIQLCLFIQKVNCVAICPANYDAEGGGSECE